MPDHPLQSRRWRILRSFLAASFVLLFLGLCTMGDGPSLTPEEKNWLTSHEGTLEVLLEEELPPYVFYDNDGEYDGFFVDYLRVIEKKLGMRLTIHTFAVWNNLLNHAKNNQNFLILGIHNTEERSDYLLFTDPVVKVPYAIVTRKTSLARSIPEFAGKKVCTVSNYAVNEDLSRHYPDITPRAVANSIGGLHAVSSGTCDAMIINQMEASYLIDQLGLTNLQIAAQTQFLNRLALATSINDPILFSILEKTVDDITPRLKREIYQRWVSTGTLELPYALRLGLQVGTGIILSAIFLLWVWTTSLRKLVENQTRQIRESEENLRTTLDSIGDAVMATDTNGNITRMNPVAEALTGWSLSEAAGQAIHQIFQLKEVHSHNPILEFRKETSINEAILISRSKEQYQIHYNVSPICDEESNNIGTVLVFRDVTHKVKAEEEHLRMKKLESLGVLAGGLAHDFNNLLTGLYGNISMASMSLPAGHEAHSYLTSAEESMEAAVALTSQFLTFSKNEKPIRRIIDLGKTLTEAASFAARGLNTRLDIAIDDDLWNVCADKGQLNQVVGNLIINAHQAMTTGGVITMAAKNIHEPSGRYVRITVQDTGTGITPEHQDKIFDPYFTTKTTGSGLGLATTHAIITKHNGTIQVESKLGVGTTFTICLPAAAEPLETRQDKKTEELMDTHALNAHILVMDDQAVIRKILETILRKMGLEVTFTVEGSEAVEAYRHKLEEGKPYDAVILDLTIPGGMGGREASEKMLAMDPKARIIISSGYASDPIMAHYEDYGIKDIAVKPYRFSDFKEILLRVLTDK